MTFAALTTGQPNQSTDSEADDVAEQADEAAAVVLDPMDNTSDGVARPTDRPADVLSFDWSGEEHVYEYDEEAEYYEGPASPLSPIITSGLKHGRDPAYSGDESPTESASKQFKANDEELQDSAPMDISDTIIVEPAAEAEVKTDDNNILNHSVEKADATNVSNGHSNASQPKSGDRFKQASKKQAANDDSDDSDEDRFRFRSISCNAVSRKCSCKMVPTPSNELSNSDQVSEMRSSSEHSDSDESVDSIADNKLSLVRPQRKASPRLSDATQALYRGYNSEYEAKQQYLRYDSSDDSDVDYLNPWPNNAGADPIPRPFNAYADRYAEHHGTNIPDLSTYNIFSSLYKQFILGNSTYICCTCTQNQLLFTSSASLYSYAQGEAGMQTITAAANPTPLGTFSPLDPTPDTNHNDDDDDDVSSIVSVYSPQREALRETIMDTLASGGLPAARLSNSVFTLEGVRNISFQESYGSQPLSAEIPTAEVIISGTVEMVAPSIFRLVEANHLYVSPTSYSATVSSVHPRDIVSSLVKALVSFVMKLFVTCRNLICLAMAHGNEQFREALRIQLHYWLLDSGSEIHIVTAITTPGLTNIRDTEVHVNGVGQRSVTFTQCGDLYDIGRAYIGPAPCNIFSAGRAIRHGATMKFLSDMNTIIVTTPGGMIFRFRRQGLLWICKRPTHSEDEKPRRIMPRDHNDDDDDHDDHVISNSSTIRIPHRSPTARLPASSATSSDSASTSTSSMKGNQLGLSMVTVEELKRKFNKKQLQEIELVKSVHEALNYPGKGTLLATINSGALLDMPPISTAGVHNFFEVYGKPAAEDAGDRVKFKPKLLPSLVDESLLETVRKVVLSIDLFFIGKLSFLIASFNLPFCERPCLVQQYLQNGKKPDALVTAITAIIGLLKVHRVEVTLLRCDLEPSLVAAKPHIETALGVRVEQVTENVASAERAIRSVKTGMRSRASALPFKLFGPLLVFLVAWTVSRLNLMVSPTAPQKLSPYHALTGTRPNFKHLCSTTFGTIVRCDSTSSDFPNTLASRSVEGIALLPVGNLHGDWYVYNLLTDRIIKRFIRKHDPIPTTQAVIQLINSKAANWSQELTISTFRGEVLDEVHDDADDSPPSHGRSGDDDHTVLDLEPDKSTVVPSYVEHQLNDDIVLSEDAIAGVDLHIGKFVFKRFEGFGDKYFQGQVTSYDPPYYKILYEDGDEEEMTAEEVIQYSAAPPRPIVAFTRIGTQYSFHMSLKKGLTKHQQAGEAAILKELSAIHTTGTLEAVDFNKLTPSEKSRAIRSMLFFKEKYLPNGDFDKLKARLVAGGHLQDRSVYSESQTSSPTVATEVVMMVATIAAKEQRFVMTADITSAFLRGKFDKGSSPIHMRLDKTLADVLIQVEPSYSKHQRPDGSIYCRLRRPLYGLIEAAKLWFDEITRTLLNLGFVQNAYDACCFNRTFRGKQHTVIIHVDDIFSTCIDNRANQQLVRALEAKYEKIGVQTGKVHSYIGMTFDFSQQGKVRVTQDGYVSELLASEDIKSAVKTPATDSLFDIDKESTRLSKSDSEHFHSVVAKLLYLSKRTRPDILVAINFLTSRVLVSTQQDYDKLIRVLKYLFGTQKWGIILEAEDNLLLLKIYIDASYGVHADGKSHTGLALMMGRGIIICKSVKQKINTKSSTEAELVALSDSISMAIWCRNFLEEQGYIMPPASVFQDNQSTIAMVRAGRPTSDRTRHVNIRFFFVADREQAGEIAIEYLPTKDMIADILTKPLQGELFLKLRKELLNWDEA